MSQQVYRKRRSVFAGIISLLIMLLVAASAWQSPEPSTDKPEVLSAEELAQPLASDVLELLPVKGRAPKTGYSRDEFGSGWASYDGCDVRNRMLASGMTDVRFGSDECTVLSGQLNDPYTGAVIRFVRGADTSDSVQIDHVVALSDAWQKGAQDLSFEDRVVFANDPLNLLAVDGPANQSKSDSDAASWLPPNKSYRCQYTARQIAVKSAYNLWLTEAEKAAIKRVLNGCGEQRLPLAT